MKPNILVHALVALLTAVTALTAASADAATIEKVRVAKHDTKIRLVFDTDKAVNYSVTTGDGSSVRIEMAGVEKAGPQPTPGISIKYAPLTSVRYQVTDEGVTAIISASSAMHAKSFSLKPDYYGGHRIVIDLARKADDLADQIEPAVVTKRDIEQHARPSNVPKRKQSSADDDEDSAEVKDALRGTGDPCGGHKRKLESNQWDMTELIDYAGCLRDGGKLLDAQAVYEKILTFDPDFHRARLAVAEVYTYLGSIEKAKSAYEHVLFSDPPPDVVKRIQAALDALPSIN